MNSLRFNLLLVAGLLGCSSKSLIILSDNGKVENAITVTTDGGSVELNRVGSYIYLTNKDEKPSEVKIMPKQQIMSKFSQVFSIFPKKPVSYIVYFKPNSLELTEKSKEILEQALNTIEEYSPCMLDIIGHTDTVGDEDINRKISLSRAEYIKSIILSRGIRPTTVVAKGFGESELFIKTEDNVSEVRNRNVEIFIK